MLCGLLGRKLSHSYSKEIHNQLASYSYELYEKEPDELEAFLNTSAFRGLNVTIPYKKDVIQFCHRLSPYAQKIGAVNTIVRENDGTLTGYNTDHYGFRMMINRIGIDVAGKKALILGSGGASLTASVVLQELFAQTIIVSRNGPNNYRNLDQHSDASIIVNCTPVGMYPDVQNSPIDLAAFPKLEGVLDLVYNPANTQMLQQAELLGIPCIKGLWMLIAQAKKSAEIFTNGNIDDSVITSIHKKMQKQMSNIILIGMPGCGKSTIGKQLSHKLNRPFIDIDEQIVQTACMSIPEIFAMYGEQYFRNLESQLLFQYGMQSGLVISTGGGCVTQPENYRHMHQNGIIIWLQRDIEKLPTDGRPLSKGGQLGLLYKQRAPLYAQFADHIIDNNAHAEDAINTIASILEVEK